MQQKLPWLPCGIFAAEVTLAAVWHFCSRSYPGCCLAFLQQKLPWLLYGIFAAEVTLAAVWHFCSEGEPGRSQQFPGVCGHPGAVPAAQALDLHRQLVLHHAATVRGTPLAHCEGEHFYIARPHSQVLRAGTDLYKNTFYEIPSHWCLLTHCVSEWVFRGKFYTLS